MGRAHTHTPSGFDGSVIADIIPTRGRGKASSSSSSSTICIHELPYINKVGELMSNKNTKDLSSTR